jgi:hypothetical protein
MRSFVLFIIVVFLMSAVVVSAQEGKINFSGEWTLNADKSEFGGGGGGRGGRGMMASSKMSVEQKDNVLTVETFRQNRDGEEISTTNTYTLDGKKSNNENNFGTTESVATWSKDGKTLTINSTMTGSRGGQEFTMESTAVWSLEGNILTVETTRSTQRGEMTSKAVYDKAVKK